MNPAKDLLQQAINQDYAAAYASKDKEMLKKLASLGMVEIIDETPRRVRYKATARARASRAPWSAIISEGDAPDYRGSGSGRTGLSRIPPRRTPFENPFHVTPKGTAFYLQQGEIGDPDTHGAQKARRILRSEGIDQPLAGHTIRKVGNQYRVIGPDGKDTGYYGLSEESAERILAKRTRGMR